MLSKTGFTHSDLLCWQSDYAGGSLNVNGTIMRDTYTYTDRGKDIIASPEGFGFENPRIIVEVKHRREQMSSQQIRSFIGGRHKDDRGLYVSTGGFSKDARYEADRSTIPLTLWTLDDLVRALVENYEQVDIETKLLVPLKKTYLPA
ncbi:MULTISPECIES: restriction endonuclease [Citrobacter]|uniref:restriction endonuclease n=1 Tax=Citrobacter TaxID=544 RepID=UPI0024DEC195|nr:MULTISPECIES: restriction endonuclease [Citrobacter]MDM2886541.1 restriction endonuclease [Citrobacter sp. Cpo045]MDM2915521.1 restriction endonuclease [Citrobacter sp. Cpo035]MDV1609834.1 restriction endonuclease [Citrobacter portucalensis]MEB0543974.1 restriction endonuclease [Citrobacter portucalensis]